MNVITVYNFRTIQYVIKGILTHCFIVQVLFYHIFGWLWLCAFHHICILMEYYLGSEGHLATKIYLKISEWLGSISVTRVFETTLAITNGQMEESNQTFRPQSRGPHQWWMITKNSKAAYMHYMAAGKESWAGQKGGGGMRVAGKKRVGGVSITVTNIW